MTEEYFPKYEIKLNKEWLTITGMFFFSFISILAIFLFSPPAAGRSTVIIIIFMCGSGILVIYGILIKNVVRVFKIDESKQMLILETFWSNIRVYKKCFPLKDIKRFEVMKRHMKGTLFLCLNFKSEKVKNLTTMLDKKNILAFAKDLNGFLDQYTSMDKAVLLEEYEPDFPKSEKKVWESFMISLCSFILIGIAIAIIWYLSTKK